MKLQEKWSNFKDNIVLDRIIIITTYVSPRRISPPCSLTIPVSDGYRSVFEESDVIV